MKAQTPNPALVYPYKAMRLPNAFDDYRKITSDVMAKLPAVNSKDTEKSEENMFNGVVTMTSVEIATLTKKSHKNVLRDIEELVKKFNEMSENLTVSNLSWLCKSSTYIDRKGESRTCYELSKQATIDLISGYSFELRYYINRRWEELEAQQAPKTEVEWIRQALHIAEEKERLALIVKEQADLIDAHVLMPKYIRAEEYTNGDYLSRKAIRLNFFPELTNNDRLTLILSYYGCEKALYRNGNIEIEVFKSGNLMDIRKQFELDSEFKRTSHGNNMIYTHPALPNIEFKSDLIS